MVKSICQGKFFFPKINICLRQMHDMKYVFNKKKFDQIHSLRDDTSNSLIGGSGLLLEFQESLLLAAVDGLMAEIVAMVIATDVVVPEVLELELFIKFEFTRGESSSLGGLTPAMTTGTLWDSQEGEWILDVLSNGGFLVGGPGAITAKPRRRAPRGGEGGGYEIPRCPGERSFPWNHMRFWLICFLEIYKMF